MLKDTVFIGIALATAMTYLCFPQAQEIVTGVLTLLACLALHRVMALQREVGELQKKVGKLELAEWVTDWGNRTAC